MKTISPEVFAIPLFDKMLIYSPLQGISALTNRSAAKALQVFLESSGRVPGQIQELCDALKETPHFHPDTRQGKLNNPLFLGIIPTRSCNLNCLYCDFLPEQGSGAMSLEMAKQTIDAYFDILDMGKHERADIQFFGGEPFHAPDVIYFSVPYARRKAENRSMEIRFEVTTNGVFNSHTARWVADNFDTVILSLDGPADIQEKQRPSRNGKPIFDTVYENAKYISSGSAELILRACVTQQTVKRMPEIASWIVEEFHPKTICFEPVHPTPQSDRSGLVPPEPVDFARQFHAAAQILERHGIPAIHSTTDINICRTSLCPVGKDALIVSPDGAVDACYLPSAIWRSAGLDFRLGDVRAGKFDIKEGTLEKVRRLPEANKAGCTNCICRYHCAGGCHVRFNGHHGSGEFGNQCMQTRLVTVTNILRNLDQNDLATDWLANDTALADFALHKSDAISELS